VILGAQLLTILLVDVSGHDLTYGNYDLLTLHCIFWTRIGYCRDTLPCAHNAIVIAPLCALAALVIALPFADKAVVIALLYAHDGVVIVQLYALDAVEIAISYSGRRRDGYLYLFLTPSR